MLSLADSRVCKRKHSDRVGEAVRNVLIKVDGGSNVPSVVVMAFSSTSTSKKLAAAILRRNQRLSRASADVSADYEGRRVTGDPRLDLAMSDHYLRL